MWCRISCAKIWIRAHVCLIGSSDGVRHNGVVCPTVLFLLSHNGNMTPRIGRWFPFRIFVLSCRVSHHDVHFIVTRCGVWCTGWLNIPFFPISETIPRDISLPIEEALRALSRCVCVACSNLRTHHRKPLGVVAILLCAFAHLFCLVGTVGWKKEKKITSLPSRIYIAAIKRLVGSHLGFISTLSTPAAAADVVFY